MITTLVWGVGLVLLLEGIVYLAAPSLVESVLKIVAEMSIQQRRTLGASMALAGSSMLFIVKFFS
tara:strand:- start:308 stop:502 length:195 start_codon:yes stop_codon:yes gene_type:complete